ncbi:MAG: hypothetical protein JJU37_09615 [Balneolaceae bacterium]|nr:hypothetical protein [Balneolaceae bacterium]
MQGEKSRSKARKTGESNITQPLENPSEKELKGIEKKADSLITIALKVGLAIILASFLAGILSGILEASTDLEIEFLSMEFFLISVPQGGLFSYIFLKLFSYFGLFEHPQNPAPKRSKKDKTSSH